MDLKTVLSTFGVVFLAELGDKTQLATLALIGAASALLVTTVIAVLAGEAITRFVPIVWLRRGAAALMIALGALLLIQRT
jgi:Ca2+/H+ antiporter, TMEM165/GDT1 family